MSRPTDHSVTAARFVYGATPVAFGEARALPTRIKSGRAASLRNGVIHIVREAIIGTDSTGATLSARWQCGGGSVKVVPVADGADGPICANCVAAAHYPVGPVVYRCFADDDALLYVGSSVNLAQRARAHKSATEWWEEVARVEAETYPTEFEARQAESVAIANEAPFYNVAGRSA